MTLRDPYLAFVDRHDVAWELTFAVLAVGFVVVGFADARLRQMGRRPAP